MQVPRIVEVPQRLEHLLADDRNSLQPELLLALKKDLLEVPVQFLHDNIRVLLKFLEAVDLGEVLEMPQFCQDVELLLDQYGFLAQVGGTLPCVFSILQA